MTAEALAHEFVDVFFKLDPKDKGRKLVEPKLDTHYRLEDVVTQVAYYTASEEASNRLNIAIVNLQFEQERYADILDTILKSRLPSDPYGHEQYAAALYYRAIRDADSKFHQGVYIAHKVLEQLSPDSPLREKWLVRKHEAMEMDAEQLLQQQETDQTQSARNFYEGWLESRFYSFQHEGYYSDPENQKPIATALAQGVVDNHLTHNQYGLALRAARQGNLPEETWDKIFEATGQQRSWTQRTLWKVNKWLYKKIGWGALVTNDTQLALN